MNLMYIFSDFVTAGQLKPIKSNCMDNYVDSFLLLKKSSSAMQDAILLAICFLRQQEACSH